MFHFNLSLCRDCFFIFSTNFVFQFYTIQQTLHHFNIYLKIYTKKGVSHDPTSQSIPKWQKPSY
jgi:hypothetical protein